MALAEAVAARDSESPACDFIMSGNDIGQGGAAAFLPAVTSGSLRVLELALTHDCADLLEGSTQCGLFASHANLEKVSLAANCIGDDFCQAIAEVMASVDANAICEIELQNNNIGKFLISGLS